MNSSTNSFEDSIKKIYETHDFNKCVIENQECLARATAYLWKASKIMFGDDPSSDDIKNLLTILLKRTAQWTKFLLDPDLDNEELRIKIFEKFLQESHDSAMDLLKDWNNFGDGDDL